MKTKAKLSFVVFLLKKSGAFVSVCVKKIKNVSSKQSVLLRERGCCRWDEGALLLPEEAEGPLMLLLQRIWAPSLLHLEQLLLLLLLLL